MNVCAYGVVGRRDVVLRAWVVCLLAACFAVPGMGEVVVLLTDATDEVLAWHDVHVPDYAPTATRARPVRINPLVFEPDGLAVGTRVELAPFPDVLVRARVDRIVTDVNRTLRIRGRIEGDRHGLLLLTIDEGRLLGSIELAETAGKYTLRYLDRLGVHLAEEVDRAREDIRRGAEPRKGRRRRDTGADEEPVAADVVSVRSGDGAEIDVMVLYTPAARDWANNWAGGINNSIAQAMERAQLTADNSGLDMTFHLVHAAEVDYTEEGDIGVDLNRLTDTDDGYMEEIHDWRDEYGADLVALFTYEHVYGGVAHLLDWKPGAPDRGFSITRVQQAHNSFTHVHEMGHNMGLHHRKDQDFQPGPTYWHGSWNENTWSAGWRWIGNNSVRYCSVMSYDEDWDGNWVYTVAHFSSPDVNHQGQPTGHAQDGDNVRTLRTTKHVVADYREAVRRTIRLTGDLYFGPVQKGQSAQRTLMLHNDGSEAIEVAGIHYPEGFSGPSWSGTLAPEASNTVTVTFEPTEARFYCGAVRVDSDASGGVGMRAAAGHGHCLEAVALAFTRPSAPVSVASEVAAYTVEGTAGELLTGSLRWTNSLTGDAGAVPVGPVWSVASVPLAKGTNHMVVTATNMPPPVLRASDSASDPAYGSGWNDGSNGGFGFEPWSLVDYEGNAGFFRGASDIGTHAWGLWANSDDTAVATRPLSNPLLPSNTFLVKFQNQWIVDEKSVGFALQNAGGEHLFEFMFIGGRESYTINDRLTGRNSGIGYTDSGLSLAFELIGPETYELRAGGHTITGELAHREDMRISRFRAWNYSAGGGGDYDFFINDLAVTNAAASVVHAAAEAWIHRAEVDEPRITVSFDTAGGAVFSWPDLADHAYDIYWSTNLTLPGGGFVPLITNIPSGAPAYTDSVHQAEQSGYYRMRIRPAE